VEWIWAVQAVAAALFLFSAYAHGVAYERSRAGRMVWLNAVGRQGALVLAALETLGALGLIVPMATQTLVWLTPVAAICLASLMVFAIVFHISRREWPNIGLNVVLGALAALVAYGRWGLLGAS